MKPFRILVLLVSTLAAAPAGAAVLVGIAGPMSGSFAPVGLEIRAGVEAAVADLNAAGGIGGEKLRTVVVDDKCDAETGAAVANQLVGKGVAVVVGHACTGAGLAAARVYAEHGIVLISPAATNPRFTDERIGPGVFRMVSRSDLQAQAVADRLLSGIATSGWASSTTAASTVRASWRRSANSTRPAAASR